jgi:MoaA/NifB/PqqE/SkfB family radical SAM enzyme
MLPQLVFRTFRTTDKRCLWKFVWNFGFKGALAVQKFKARARRGVYFPPFFHLSIINSCNLRCQGCWIDVEAPEELIALADFNRMVNTAKAHGNYFFGLLGGEPLLHPQLTEMVAAHPECYFQVFTNGQLVTEKVAQRWRQLGNVSPLVSIEGLEGVSDERRGNKQVFKRTLAGLEHCVRARLLTGVATSVCQSNIHELLTEDWLRRLIELGVHYVWYYTYRPVGPQPNPQLALRADQQLQVRRFVVDMRARIPIGIVDAYNDGQGRALCPMAAGISHHISPRGEIEPCPVIQFAAENIKDPGNVYDTMTRSAFLRDFRETARSATRGCIVLERPDLVKALALKHGARRGRRSGTRVT